MEPMPGVCRQGFLERWQVNRSSGSHVFSRCTTAAKDSINRNARTFRRGFLLGGMECGLFSATGNPDPRPDRV